VRLGFSRKDHYHLINVALERGWTHHQELPLEAFVVDFKQLAGLAPVSIINHPAAPLEKLSNPSHSRTPRSCFVLSWPTVSPARVICPYNHERPLQPRRAALP
jgi:hypothetical protein